MFEVSYLLSATEPRQYISGLVLSIMNATFLGALKSADPCKVLENTTKQKNRVLNQIYFFPHSLRCYFVITRSFSLVSQSISP